MKSLPLALLALFAASLAAQPATAPTAELPDSPATTQAAIKVDPTPTSLEGTWLLVSAEYLGEKMPAAEADGKRVVFRGNQMVMLDKGQQIDTAGADAGMIKLDDAAEPKQLTMSDPEDANAVFSGIYKLENGELTIVMSQAGGERPKAFDATGVLKIVLKKA